MHEGEVLHAVEGRDVGVAGELHRVGLHGEGRDALDQLLPGLAIGDEIGDRDALDLVLLGELRRSARPLITVPSSLASSQITPTGGSPASLQRSTAASVWPERISTPPSLAISGKTWPGRTKSAAPMLPLASARTVLERCSAEMPVVRPCWTSTETVKAVPSGASLAATIGERLRRVASALVTGAQTMPQVLRMMKAIFSGVQSDGGADEIALVLAVVVIGDDDDFAAGEGLDGSDDGVGHGTLLWAVSAVTRSAGMKSLGVTAPPVSRQISSAVSRDIQAESLLQSCGDGGRRHARPPREIARGRGLGCATSRRASHDVPASAIST